MGIGTGNMMLMLLLFSLFFNLTCYQLNGMRFTCQLVESIIVQVTRDFTWAMHMIQLPAVEANWHMRAKHITSGDWTWVGRITTITSPPKLGLTRDCTWLHPHDTVPCSRGTLAHEGKAYHKRGLNVGGKDNNPHFTTWAIDIIIIIIWHKVYLIRMWRACPSPIWDYYNECSHLTTQQWRKIPLAKKLQARVFVPPKAPKPDT